MAFLNRVGNLLKQAASKHATPEHSASNASLFLAIRSMASSSKLFIGGLSYSTDEMSLREAFSEYGEVVEARVILDRDSGRSRGFGFVTYTSTDAASSAIQAFDGQDLHGRRIRVSYATERPRGGGFGGGFGASGGPNYGRGAYLGGSYPRGDGNFGGGGGFGSSNQYTGGAAGSIQGGSSDDYLGDSQTNFSGKNDDIPDSSGGYQGSSGVASEDLVPDELDETSGDNSDEPNDYANKRN